MAKNEEAKKAKKAEMAKAEEMAKNEETETEATTEEDYNAKMEDIKKRWNEAKKTSSKIPYKEVPTEKNKTITLYADTIKKLAELFEAKPEEFKTYYSWKQNKSDFEALHDMLVLNSDIFYNKAEA